MAGDAIPLIVASEEWSPGTRKAVLVCRRGLSVSTANGFRVFFEGAICKKLVSEF
jgi:hypothetical protein